MQASQPTRAVRILILLVTLIACADARERPGLPAEGPWRAWLESPGGELPFGLELAREDGEWSAVVHNGSERIRVDAVRIEGDELVIEFPHYDSRLRGRITQKGRRLEGDWRKRSGPERWSQLDFEARAGAAPRFRIPPDARPTPASFTGRWRVAFESGDVDAVGLFENAAGAEVRGTFRTATGDYRWLAGDAYAGRMRLSAFDGAHAFLFHARAAAEGRLEGEFWSSDRWHERWQATADPEASLPDAFSQTDWTGEVALGDLRFPDLEGRPRRLDDPAFAGEARILYVFGSWCPNCADATRFLTELHRRYAGRGLSILGLAFEVSGEPERDRRQVRRYAEHHGVAYPLLVAGLSDKTAASRALPVLDRVRSYPTTIFLDGENRVRAVHTGFDGPATGEAHQRLRERFEGLLEQLLPPATDGAGDDATAEAAEP